MIGNYIGAPIGGVVNRDIGNTGILDVVLDDATIVATGTLAIAGQVSLTLEDASLIATGTSTISAVADILLEDADITATGALAITGTATTVLDDATLVATAHVAPRVIANIKTGGRAPSPAALGTPLALISAAGAGMRPGSGGRALTRAISGGGRL